MDDNQIYLILSIGMLVLAVVGVVLAVVRTVQIKNDRQKIASLRCEKEEILMMIRDFPVPDLEKSADAYLDSVQMWSKSMTVLLKRHQRENLSG